MTYEMKNYLPVEQLIKLTNFIQGEVNKIKALDAYFEISEDEMEDLKMHINKTANAINELANRLEEE